MPLFLLEETIDEAALVVAGRLRRLAEGAIDSPLTWRQIARDINLQIREYHAPGCGRGEFVPGSWGNPRDTRDGVVAVNTGYSLLDICRAYAHEIAHAILHQWVPPILEECRDAWMYEGNPADVRHRIARRVEELLFGKSGKGGTLL